MRYNNVVGGIFSERLNRFEAAVYINGAPEIVHVRNTGRCANVLLKGAEIALERSNNTMRKTRYSLIAVKNERLGWVNIDSAAPNKAAAEWLQKQQLTIIKPEYTFGKSRVDFYMEQDNRKMLMEVKGCTLENDGVGYFPDAPTKRGVKHLKELAEACALGYECCIAFVIQMNGISEVRANSAVHAEFADELERAYAAGVGILFLQCRVERESLEIISSSFRKQQAEMPPKCGQPLQSCHSAFGLY